MPHLSPGHPTRASPTTGDRELTDTGERTAAKDARCVRREAVGKGPATRNLAGCLLYFEATSYGFRPGRSAHDAKEAILRIIGQKSKYLLDADIRGCFDAIAHQALLDKLATYPALRQSIKGWLKAGVIADDDLIPTSRGTPQGGVASPLLANVALHGLETAVKAATGAYLVRYADDFVCFHPTREGIAAARHVIDEQLAAMGLELHPTKTPIAHTLDAIEGRTGCDFLGFSIRQYRCGRYRSGTNGHGTPLGFKTLIKPSKEAVKHHLDHLRTIIRRHRAAPQEELIAALNPVIRGWSAYHRTVVAKETFSRCDHLASRLLWNWAHRRHAQKANRWIKARYWRASGIWRWRFATPSGVALALHAATPIKRHVKVRGTASPYDGNLLYWGQRLQHHPLTGAPLARALQRQRWRCAGCGLTLREGDLIELDHIVPTTAGGTNDALNRQALHRHCHDTKTHDDGSRPLSTRGIL